MVAMIGWMQINLNIDSLENTMYSQTKGKFAGYRIPRGYKLIRVYTIFDVKVDGRHKARVVTDRHLTATPAELVYLGVASLRGL